MLNVVAIMGRLAADPQLRQACLVRTARKILEGTLYVPDHALA